MRAIITSLLVMAMATVATYAQTDGFTVLTTESARRASVAREPVQLPDVQLQSAAGDMGSLKAALRDDGRVAVVNFIYTRCASVCVVMGAEFQQMQDVIVARGLQDKVRLISISFDPRDTPQWLGRYHDRMKADPAVWQALLAADEIQRQELLDAFGIIVVPAPMGQYEHNTAYHVVTPDGRLARIVDINNPDVVLHYAAQQADALDAEGRL